MDILKVLNKFKIDKFNFLKTDSGVNVITLNHYLPFDYSNTDTCEIDSYYVASNKNYFLIKDILAELNKNGYTATIDKNSNFKQIAVKSNLVKQGHNTLTYDCAFGSYFCLGIISIVTNETEANNLIKLNVNSGFGDLCKGCEKCSIACPTGAITKNKPFNKEKCIRFQQENKSTKNIDILSKAGNKLLGCDICQKCCPLNKDIKLSDIDKNLLLLLEKPNILNNISDNKKLEELAYFIGSNYARANMLTPLIKIVLHNCNKS